VSRVGEIKREARRGASLDRLASSDLLASTLGHAIVRRCDRSEPFGPPRFDAPPPALLNYYLRKLGECRASYFRLRYGRDYWTGRRRHARERDAWWNEGYQDGVEGSVLIRQPAAWSDRRWRAYCAGNSSERRDYLRERDA
jgi:hypothetical protein